MTMSDIAGFEVGGMGPHTKECRWLPLEAGKGNQTDFTWDPPREISLPPFVFSLMGTISNLTPRTWG